MTYPFDITVFIQRRPHMRDDNLEYQLHIGKGILHQLFDHERVDPSVTEATFFYPERWLNIVEERSLFDRLQHFCPNLKKVTIVTQSVYIIQSTPGGCAKIIASEDEQRETAGGKLTQEATTGRLWYKNAMVRDFSQLQVLGL
jgi:hypothetical protein